MVDRLNGDPAQYQPDQYQSGGAAGLDAFMRAFAGAAQPTPPIMRGMPPPQSVGTPPPQAREPYADTLDMITKAYYRAKNSPTEDPITKIIKQGGSPFSRLEEAQMTGEAILGFRNVEGAPSFGERLNAIRSRKIGEAEKLATAQLASEKLENERRKDFAAEIVRITVLGEQMRHNRATEEKKTDFDKKIDYLAQHLPREIAIGIAAGRYKVVQDMAGMPTGVIDIGTGKNIWAIGEQAPTGPIEPPPTATPSTIDPAQATGASGFFGNIANTASDLFAGKLVAPKMEAASSALDSLHVQTQTALRPTGHRPTNYLMEQFGKLAVEPKSLWQGDQRSALKVKQVINMLKAEISRIDRQVLGNQGGYKKEVISEARGNRSELEGLLREYEVVLKGFEKSETDKLPKISGPDDPAYKSLKSGDPYIRPDGKRYIKK
jgi:hypothetical protein